MRLASLNKKHKADAADYAVSAHSSLFMCSHCFVTAPLSLSLGLHNRGSMVKVIAVFGILFLTNSVASAACNSDFDCGFGNKCVDASGDINITGICVTPGD